MKVQAGRLLSITSKQDDAALVATDLVVLPASFMSAAGQVDAETGTVPIRRWLERAAVDGHVRVLSTETNRSHWYQDVRDAADVQAAERKLFNSLKGEFEGFVDRFFNRKISRWFTRIFLAAGLSPNAITILATVVGLVAAAGFGVGTYSAGIIAALLFQLAAIIDCCDGEVARLTFTESPFGAWLDIAMDNVVHMAIFAGIAVGSYLARGWERRCVGSSCPGCGSGPWKRAFVLARHPRAKDQGREWMEDTGAGCLVRLHAQERREPGFLRHRADFRCDRQARLVSLDGRDRIRGVLAPDAVGHQTLRHDPCLSSFSFVPAF